MASQLQREVMETRAEYLTGIHRISAGAALLFLCSLMTSRFVGIDLVHPYLAWPGVMMSAAFFWMARIAKKQQRE